MYREGMKDVHGNIGPGSLFAQATSTGEDDVLTLRLAPAQAAENGAKLDQLIRKALASGGETPVRDLAELAAKWPRIVLRHRAVHDFLDGLHSDGLEQAWKRVLGRGRGRPHRDYRHLVAWVERLIREGTPAERAFKTLSREAQWGKTWTDIRRLYYKHREAYGLENEGVYLDPKLYHDAMWEPPER